MTLLPASCAEARCRAGSSGCSASSPFRAICSAASCPPSWRSARTVTGGLAFGPRPRAGRLTVLWSLLFPVLWLAYTLVRGAIWKWYPYPFLDVTSHGYARVIVNALVVTVVFGLVAALFAFGDGRLPAAPRTRALA